MPHCRVGAARSCWCLGNSYTEMGQHDKAYSFACKHLELSMQVCVRVYVCQCVCVHAMALSRVWRSCLVCCSSVTLRECHWQGRT